MATYVLTNKNTDELETTVFSGEGGDAVAVFTDPNNAQTYLADAGWEDTMVVAQFDPIPFLEWLLHCHHSGVRQATDPSRSDHEAGIRVNTLDIEGQLQHAGEHIFRVANPDF